MRRGSQSLLVIINYKGHLKLETPMEDYLLCRRISCWRVQYLMKSSAAKHEIMHIWKKEGQNTGTVMELVPVINSQERDSSHFCRNVSSLSRVNYV